MAGSERKKKKILFNLLIPPGSGSNDSMPASSFSFEMIASMLDAWESRTKINFTVSVPYWHLAVNLRANDGAILWSLN